MQDGLKSRHHQYVYTKPIGSGFAISVEEKTV